MNGTAAILDLDGTLIDTSAIQELRDAREWRACVSNAHRTRLYAGVIELVHSLSNAGIAIAVCTSSVSFYAHALLEHHGINPSVTVCYHDTKRHKPHPDPVLLAMKQLGVAASRAIGVGDRTEDAEAYRTAGVQCVGAGWNPVLERSAHWDAVASSAVELAEIAVKRLRA